MRSFGFAEDIVFDFPDEKSITCGICLGFPRQIQVNWEDWGDTMGISLTNAMVVGFACQWVGSFQRNPWNQSRPMKSNLIHPTGQTWELSPCCASWQVAAWFFFLLIYWSNSTNGRVAVNSLLAATVAGFTMMQC